MVAFGFQPRSLDEILAGASGRPRLPTSDVTTWGGPTPLWAIAGEAPPTGSVLAQYAQEAGQEGGGSSTPESEQGRKGEVRNPGGYEVSPEVMQHLEEFSRRIGKPVVITGGNRPAKSQLGAGRSSQHVSGTAADFYVPGQEHLETANQALESGLFNGVGWYEEGYRGPHGEGPHVHVDMRPLPPGGHIKQWGKTRKGADVRIPPYPGAEK